MREAIPTDRKMITLILEDFRSFAKREFTFEECSSTLISGHSGAGKTTVFMGIIFAVYGTGRDLIRHGKKKCVVVMKTDCISITRSKGPERLVVVKEGLHYEKDEAQAVIDATFPHLSLGYVSQMMHRSFLMLTPADKLKFIESMTFDKTFVETINKNVRTLVSERRLELEKTRKERETMESMLVSLNVERTTSHPEGQFSAADERATLDMQVECSRRVNDAVHENNRRQVLQRDLERLDRCDATVAELQERIKTLTEEEYRWNQYVKVSALLETKTRPAHSVEEMDAMIATWLRIGQIDRDLVRAKNLQKRLDAKVCVKPLKTVAIADEDVDEYLRKAKAYEDAREIDELIAALPTCRWTCSELEEMRAQRERARVYAVNRKRLDRLLAKKADCTLIKTCPSCRSTLGLWNGELFRVDDPRTEHRNSIVLTREEAVRLDDEILSLSVQCSRPETVDAFEDVDIDAEMKRQKRVEDQMNILLKRKAALCSDGLDYDPDVTRELKSYIKSMELYRQNMEENALIEARLEEYRDVQKERDRLQDPPFSQAELQTMKKSAQEYTYLEKKCADLACERPAESSDTYRKMLVVATERQSKLAQLASIRVTDEECASLQRELHEIEARLDLIRDHMRSREAYEQWKKVHDVTVVEKDLEVSHPRAVYLQALIHEAQKESLEETLDQLNFYSQLYLEKFMDDLSIEFVFDTKISVNMIHDGHKTDANSLSGGEYSRVTLAVTLALAEMNGVQLLMLDESIASLDQDTTSEVLDAIRENFTGTILCIAHQTVKGTFDHVVEL